MLVSVDFSRLAFRPFFHIIAPCPPVLSSTASYPPCDYKSGPNPAPPLLQGMPLPMQQTGMTTLKASPSRPLTNHPLVRTATTQCPGSQIFPSQRTGTTTVMRTVPSKLAIVTATTTTTIFAAATNAAFEASLSMHTTLQ